MATILCTSLNTLRRHTMPSKPLPGPSRLSGILKGLNKPPKPSLPSLKGLSVTLAAKNGDFGARCVSLWLKAFYLLESLDTHDRRFLKDDVPRIRYANQDLTIQVNSIPKSNSDTWKAEMVLEFSVSSIQRSTRLETNAFTKL